jgi:hypothetical protein
MGSLKEPTRGVPLLWGFGVVLHLIVKIYHVTRHFTKPWTRTELLTRRQQWKKYTRLIKIHEAMILPVILRECKTWSLTLREELRLNVFANRVHRGIDGSKRDEVTGEWRRLHNEELYDLYSSTNIFESSNGGDGQGMWHVSETGQVHTTFLWGDLKKRDHLEGLSIIRRITLKLNFKKSVWVARTRLIWLRIGTGGGLLRLWFQKKREFLD